jgi:hypothetical protein
MKESLARYSRLEWLTAVSFVSLKGIKCSMVVAVMIASDSMGRYAVRKQTLYGTILGDLID